MPARTNTAKKKSRYEIMALRAQVYCFAIDATSPEAACKSLWRRQRYNYDPGTPDDARLVCSTWCDPQDEGEGWLVAGGPLPLDPTGATAHGWNGKEVVRVKLR